jgi:hypothetical protein
MKPTLNTPEKTIPLSQKVRELSALFDEGKAWDTFALASDKDGYARHPTDPEACAFCLLGGIAKVENISSIQDTYGQAAKTPLAGILHRSLTEIAPDTTMGLTYTEALYTFNDSQTSFIGIQELLNHAEKKASELDATGLVV